MTAVVIGAASGIGAAVASLLADSGVEVLTWDVADGTDIRCDLSDPDDVEASVTATIERIGPPDSVTITAGVGHSGMLLDVSVEEWDRVQAVNLRGVWLASRGLARHMLGGDGGSIVVTSSISGSLADQSMGAYCVSKAALDMFVAVAAEEWAPTVRVNAIAPGVTDTPMLGRAPRGRGWLGGVADRTALGRLGTADDIAEAIVHLHEMHWITGQVVACDGGLANHSPIDPMGPSV